MRMKLRALLLFSLLSLLPVVSATAINFQITDISGGLNGTGPDMNESGEVVWSALNREIIHYNGATSRKIDTKAVGSSPRINDMGEIAYHGPSGAIGSTDDIFFYDGTGIVNISNLSGDDRYPRLNSKGQFLWIHETPMLGYTATDVFYKNDSDITNISNSPAIVESEHEINSNGHSVWTGFDGTDYEIYYYDGKQTINLSNNTGEDRFPQINDQNHIVWQSFNGSDNDIYYYDGSGVRTISSNPADDQYPHIKN